MIFVTVGSQKFQFNRLLKKVDQMAGNGVITEEVCIQTGVSDYIPGHCRHRPFYNRNVLSEMIGSCSILITHGGEGIMVDAVKRGKKTIVVPRLARYGEHVDDHQLELTQRFHKMGLVCACPEVERLAEALQWVQDYRPAPFRSNTEAFLASLDAFLNAL